VTILFRHPTYRERGDVVAAFKFARANYAGTELAKRREEWVEAKRRELWQNGDKSKGDPPDTFKLPKGTSIPASVENGCSADDFRAEVELSLVGIEETKRLIEQIEIPTGHRLELEGEKLREEIEQIQGSRTFVGAMSEACLTIFDLRATNGAGPDEGEE
jgi:hypothetical protein